MQTKVMALLVMSMLCFSCGAQESFVYDYLGEWEYVGQFTNKSMESFRIVKKAGYGINIFGELIFPLQIDEKTQSALFTIKGVGPGESKGKLLFLSQNIEFYSFFENEWILRGVFVKKKP